MFLRVRGGGKGKGGKKGGGVGRRRRRRRRRRLCSRGGGTEGRQEGGGGGWQGATFVSLPLKRVRFHSLEGCVRVREIGEDGNSGACARSGGKGGGGGGLSSASLKSGLVVKPNPVSNLSSRNWRCRRNWRREWEGVGVRSVIIEDGRVGRVGGRGETMVKLRLLVYHRLPFLFFSFRFFRFLRCFTWFLFVCLFVCLLFVYIFILRVCTVIPRALCLQLQREREKCSAI